MPTNGQVNRASAATKTVNWDSTTSSVKLQTPKIDIHSFADWRSAIKRDSVKSQPCVGNRWHVAT